jgi:alpha-tubulin suppressor-like RCC1 family protein
MNLRFLSIHLSLSFFLFQASGAAPTPSLGIWGSPGVGQVQVPAGVGELTKISTGENHVVALTAGGAAVAWGDPAHGKCDVPPNATNLIDVVAGPDFSAAVQANGKIIIWGGTNRQPRLVVNFNAEPSRGLVALSHFTYSLASLRSNGSVVAWGTSGDPRSYLAPLTGFNSVAAIAGGLTDHVFGMRSNGTVVAWGAAPMPYLTPPAGLTNVIGIASGGNHGVALRSDGSVAAWGMPGDAIAVPPDLTNATLIAAAGQWNLAQTSDGRLVAWGATPVDPEDFSSLAVPAGLKDLTAITLSQGSAIGLTTNPLPCLTHSPRSYSIPVGWPVEFYCWASGQPPLNFQWYFNDEMIPGATGRSLTITNSGFNTGEYKVVVANSFGSVTSKVANLVTGPVLGWGDRWLDQPIAPALLTDCTKVSAGFFHSAALLPDGRVKVWGSLDVRHVPRLQELESVKDLNCGSDGGIALLSNGTTRAWAPRIPATSAATAPIISADVEFSGQVLAVLADGTVFCWPAPMAQWPWSSKPADLTNAVTVSAGQGYGLVLRSDGTVANWGFTSAVGAPLSSITGVVQVAAGLFEGFALKADGTAISLKTGAIIATNAVSISAGNQQVLALKADGSVAVAGNNTTGEGILPGPLSNVVEVAAGFSHNLIRFGDGSPHLTISPFSRQIAPGGATVLTTFAAGVQPITYQWQLNGSDLTGETNSSLVITGANGSAAGQYRCVVTNARGSAMSDVAHVSISFPQPLLVPGVAGAEDFSFTVTGLSGQGSLVVYASTNLIHWEPVLTNAPGPASVLVTQPKAANDGVIFYKASEQR